MSICTGTWKNDSDQTTGDISVDIPYFGNYDALNVDLNFNGQIIKACLKKQGNTCSITSIDKPLINIYLKRFYSRSGSKWKGVFKKSDSEQGGSVILEHTITCTGCLEDQPGQLAHMDIGGCLAE